MAEAKVGREFSASFQNICPKKFLIFTVVLLQQQQRPNRSTIRQTLEEEQLPL